MRRWRWWWRHNHHSCLEHKHMRGIVSESICAHKPSAARENCQQTELPFVVWIRHRWGKKKRIHQRQNDRYFKWMSNKCGAKSFLHIIIYVSNSLRPAGWWQRNCQSGFCLLSMGIFAFLFFFVCNFCRHKHHYILSYSFTADLFARFSLHSVLNAIE